MSLPTSIVDLESLQVDLNLIPFDVDSKKTEIEALAHTITELKSVLRIPVVRSLGIDEYKLISGYLEYFAYLKAREFDPELPDRITVFIVNSNDEHVVLKQLEVSQTVERERENTDSDLKISNLESRIEQNSRELSKSFEQLKQEILKTVDSKLPQPLPPLEAFNRILEPAIQVKAEDKLSRSLKKNTVAKVIKKLVEYKRKNPDIVFTKFGTVLEILIEIDSKKKSKKIVSAEKMLEVIDKWSD